MNPCSKIFGCSLRITPKLPMATITAYGGVGEIGGNKLLVENSGTSILLDFGYGFGAEAVYYEEFLQPRANAKLHDLITFGLTPKLDGIYRQDALRPVGSEELSVGLAKSLWNTDIQSHEAAETAGNWTPDAMFLSHAYLDHAGYLPYLGDIPLYCSPDTETVLEALVDLGSLTGFDNEFLEINRREIDEYSGGYFPGEPQLNRQDPQSRTINHTTPSNRLSVGTLELEVFDVGHSIPGALACLLVSSDQQIVYTGDLRFHGRSGIDLGEALEGLQPDALLCEGTRIEEDTPD